MSILKLRGTRYVEHETGNIHYSTIYYLDPIVALFHLQTEKVLVT